MKNKTRIAVVLLIMCALISVLTLVSCNENAADNNTSTDEQGTNAVVYSITYKGVELIPGAPAKEVIEAIDEEYVYEEAGSCVGDGKDKRYSYSSIRIETVNNDGVDYISAIYLTNDLYATDDGLTIGSPEAQIKAKYGELCEIENGVYTYTGKDKTTLRVFTKNESVTSIAYLWN